MAKQVLKLSIVTIKKTFRLFKFKRIQLSQHSCELHHKIRAITLTGYQLAPQVEKCQLYKQILHHRHQTLQ
jgi:hypothetical protein